MPGRSWRQHFVQLLVLAVVLVLVGTYFGHPLSALLIALVALSAWMLVNMKKLFRWLDSDHEEPPEGSGAWSDVFESLHRLQRRNQEQNERNEQIIEEFRGMTDAFPDATLLLDENDTITWFNEASRQLLGLRVPEDIGQPVTNLLRDPDFADWISVDEQVESAFEMTSPVDPNVHLTVVSVRHLDDQRLLILRNITELHNLERVRRDLVANVSHELRTPLTVLLGYLESMHDHVDEELQPAISRMQEQGWQMEALLNDLLELSRLQSESQTESESEINVCAMLLQLKEQAEEMSQGNHDIRVTCESGLGMVGNEKDVESAFRNLLSNAIHYTPKGGTIEIAWEDRQEGLVYRVQDSGIGIPARDIPRLTERFYRVGSDRSRHRGGTGLGLAIVKHVLNAHGAHLEVESELGEGSQFSCIFPDERRITIDHEPAAQDNDTT